MEENTKEINITKEDLIEAYIFLKKTLYYENNNLLHLKYQIAEFEEKNNFLDLEKREKYFRKLEKEIKQGIEGIKKYLTKIKFTKIIKKLEENEENKIIIWPDVPYWLYVNNDTQKIIQIISEHSNFNEMAKAVKLYFSEKVYEDELQSLFEELCEAKVIEHGMEDEEIKDPNTHYIIRTVTLNITDKCNLFCKHCYIGASSRKVQFMKLQDAKKVVDAIWPYMNPSCSFIVSGGEALLNPDCIEILEYITSRGKGKINLVTNGTTITPELADKLSKIRGLSIQVSLDGATEKVHEAIRGKGSYKNTMRGLQLLAERNNFVSYGYRRLVK